MKEQKHYDKIIIGVVIGILLSTIGVYATTVLSGSDVTYDNSKSGGSFTSVQGSIEELYKLSEEAGKKCPEGYTCIKNTVAPAYTYNQTSGASNYCVTGTESTCQKTECYRNKTAGSCPAGTIINFKVNNTVTVPFHVMFDEGETMTMQSQRNIVSNIAWNAAGSSKKGPTDILPALENATSSWSNVNTQTYTIGTSFLSGCSEYNSCTTNKYTLAQRTAKARLATVQELANIGCTRNTGSCPKWVYNYLYSSTNFGGSVSDTTQDGGEGRYGYWTMNAYTDSSDFVWHIGQQGRLWYTISPTYSGIGARAVVMVSK